MHDDYSHRDKQNLINGCACGSLARRLTPFAGPLFAALPTPHYISLMPSQSSPAATASSTVWARCVTCPRRRRSLLR
eukprot:366328-Chlamydomonas_euryale.AAC.20